MYDFDRLVDNLWTRVVPGPILHAMSTEQIQNAITENATGPAKASGDEGSVEQHRLSEQIAAARFAAAQAAATNKRTGVRVLKFGFPGANG